MGQNVRIDYAKTAFNKNYGLVTSETVSKHLNTAWNVLLNGVNIWTLEKAEKTIITEFKL